MSDIPHTRQSLLLALGRRCDDAWVEFLQVYENAIYRCGRAQGLQDADARDVTQEVLAAVHRRVASWDHDAARGSFRAWLFRAVRNISVDRITERARRATGGSQAERVLREYPDASSDTRGDTGTALDLEVQRALFEWAANEVRAEVRAVTWRAFHATAVEGHAPEEVAAELAVPVGSVYTAKCRVVARIRARVARMRDVPGAP